MSEMSSSHGGQTSADSVPIQELFHLNESESLDVISAKQWNVSWLYFLVDD
jgi:hypothetical protein